MSRSVRSRTLQVRLGLCGIAVCQGCHAQAQLDQPHEEIRPASVTTTTSPLVAAAELPRPAAPPPAPAPALTATTSARGDGTLEIAGDLRPNEAAELAFKIPGQLAWVKAERGLRVKRGQLLAALVDGEARAQLAQSEAAVRQARAQLALVRDNESRAASLVAANAAPGSQAVQVKLQAEAMEAALLQAQAARDLATATLSNHQLRAPFDGEITRVPDGVGGIVAPGTPLFRIESLDTLVLRATVSESDLERVQIGDDVSIPIGGGKRLSGKVRTVLRSLESTSRRAPVEISVPNGDRTLVAGSYVRATLKVR